MRRLFFFPVSWFLFSGLLSQSHYYVRLFIFFVLVSCSTKNAAPTSEERKAEIKGFINEVAYNWNWCYPQISKEEIKEMFAGDYFYILSEDYLKHLETYLYSVATFCDEGGSFLVLASAKEEMKSIIPVTASAYEDNQCQSLKGVIDKINKGDLIGLEYYLNNLKPSMDSLEEEELANIFNHYLSRKYQSDLSEVKNARITDGEELSKALLLYEGQYSDKHDKLSGMLGCLFLEDKEEEDKKNLYFLYYGPGKADLHLFIVMISNEVNFLKTYPFRVHHYVL